MAQGKGTARNIAERDAKVAEMRFRGHTWAEIVEATGLSRSNCDAALRRWRDANPNIRLRTGAEPLVVIDEQLDMYEQALADLAAIVADPETTASEKTSAILAKLRVLDKQTNLLQQIDVLPRNLGSLRVHMDFRYVIETIFTSMKEEGVPPAVQKRILGVLEAAEARRN